MASSFCNLVPGEAYDKRQSGKRLPDQLRHRSRLLFLLIWRHLQPMMTMLQSANELQHWRKTKTTTPSKRSFCCHWLLHSKKNPCQVRQKKRDCKINVTVIFPTKRSCLVPMSDASPTAWISDCVPTSWRFLALILWANTLPMGAANISERATWKIIHQWSGRVADHETNPGTLTCGRHTRNSMYYYPMCKHQNRCQGSQSLQSMEDEMQRRETRWRFGSNNCQWEFNTICSSFRLSLQS